MTSGNPSPRKLLIALGVLCCCGLVVLFGVVPYAYSYTMHVTSVFGALATMWKALPDFQHGMLVPLISAFVIYTRRKQLAALPITGWWPGFILVLIAFGLFWAGRRVDNQYAGFLSIQIILASLVLWLLGWRWLVNLAFPLAFLAFAWPLPFLDEMVMFPLRMLMSNMSVGLLNLFGLSVIQNGSGIVSAPNPAFLIPAGRLFSVDVADPCSGIRSLIALMMVSAVYANFTQKSGWKRAALFLSSIPLAICGNLFRILLLTLGIITLGAPTAIGTLENPTWFHYGAGFAIFFVALSGMVIVGHLLSSDPVLLRQKWRSLLSGSTSSGKSNASTSEHEAQVDIY